MPGLTEAEAARRLAEYGPNEIEARRDRSLGAILASVLREPMFLLLIGASVLYLALGELGEGLFLSLGALVTIGLVVSQELRSERALTALRALAEPTVRVIRDGAEQRIAAHRLVPGDLMLMAEGERVAADARLLPGALATLDESALTGESAPVTRQGAGGDPPAGEEDPRVILAGSMVVGGQGSAEVVATGARTAFGRIGASLAAIDQAPTPLQQSARRVVAMLGGVAIAFCLLVTAAYGWTRGDWIEAVLAGVTFAIALIPEEFPMVLAVFMALGAWRLARHRVLVRRPAVVETLGAASVLCVDKTGTLTENRMTVARLWADGVEHAADAGAPVAALATAAARACAPHPTDPMDRAVRALSAQPAGETLERAWPLTPERLAVVQLWRRADGGWAAGAKGAPEAVFRLCRLPPERTAALTAAVERMAGEGLRVLGVASAVGEGAPVDDPAEAAFAFEGLAGFLDPVRADVPAALAEAGRAGVAVVMITGDYPATALAVARQAGLDLAGGVLTGAEAAAMPFPLLRRRVKETRVFARVRPEQKLLLVEAFKANGEVVAMTGDGVNDAPALEAAHIGLAMGRRGTDVAREAADLVLLDDSFPAIVGGIRLGRRIFANLRKALIFIAAIHIPIAGLAIAPIVMGLPPMLFPVHVVLLELVIDPVCSLVFEAEPSDEGAMERPPRPAAESLFGARQLLVAAVQGALLLAAVLAVYAWSLGAASEAQARGAAFVALIAGNLLLAFSDFATSGARLFDRRRAPFWLICLVAAGVLGAILGVPALAEVFRMAPPPLAPAAVAAAALAAAFALFRLAFEGERRGRT
jgi:Ca2+-transporting ATPase